MNMLREMRQMVFGMVRGEYPDFVTGKRVGTQIPVFTFHRVDEEPFEKQLDFLRRNGYNTLNSRELEDRVVLRKNSDDRLVSLTFDDGLVDVYTTVFPLLQKYDVKAIVFVAPFWVGAEGFVSWAQVQEMHDSGLVDIQAHSYSHGRIPVSPEIVDFFHGDYPFYQKWDVIQQNGSGAVNRDLPAWGTPLLKSASCLSDRLCLMRTGEIKAHYLQYVDDHGGEAFFRDPKWKLRLASENHTVKRSDSFVSEYESTKNQMDRIRYELNLARTTIQEHLPGKDVTSFAFPYHEGGLIANRLMQACGYRLIFGGIEDVASGDSGNGSVRHVRRVSGDFVMRLPGRGRRSLVHILLSKAMRRMKSGGMF